MLIRPVADMKFDWSNCHQIKKNPLVEHCLAEYLAGRKSPGSMTVSEIKKARKDLVIKAGRIRKNPKVHEAIFAHKEAIALFKRGLHPAYNFGARPDELSSFQGIVFEGVPIIELPFFLPNWTIINLCDLKLRPHVGY